MDPTGLATGVVTEVGKQIVTKLWEIVERGLKYESTAQHLASAEQELSPMFEEIGELGRTADLPPQEIQSLQMFVTKMKKARFKYTNIGKQFWLKPYYQKKIEKVEQEVKDFITGQLTAQTARNVLKILNLLQTRTTDQTNDHIVRPQILKADLQTLPESTLELQAALKNKLRSDLMKDGGDQVLNLTGFAGSGKTTLAKQLCRDPLVRDWFEDNVFFVSVGPEIESNGEVAKQLQDELGDKGKNKAVFLVLDNVEARSKQLVQRCWNQISSNSVSKSKILVISSVALEGLGTPMPMMPLDEDDAIALLRHFVQPLGATSYNFPDHHTLRQVVKGCGGFPLAIKIIGSDLQGKPIVFWKKVSNELSQKGPYSLHTHAELLTHLKNSLSVLSDYERISEFFKDLGLFPENQMIPVPALIDMWVELYRQDEEGIEAMINIHKLTAMNLADPVVQRRLGSDADDYHDNHFLTQHNIFRELANKCSSEEGEVLERKRLIIGNDRPEGWPQEPQQRVAARMLSISTDQKVTPDWCNIQADQAVVLILNLKNSEYTFPEFIEEMGNLKVLTVTNYGFYPTELSNLELLGSLWNLKRIRLQQVTVPSLCNLKNVHKLSLYMCEVKKAFEDSSMEFSEAMPNLADLNIEYCKDLVILPPTLCNILTLKSLNIRSCHKFTGLPQEIGNLENLELLRISYCANFEAMPESITELKSLTFLDISYCVNLKKLPDNIGGLQNLRKLYMMGCPIHELPDSIINFEHLESVICNENISHLWEVIGSSGLRQSNLDIETAKTDVNLNWLFDFGSRGFIL